MASYRLTRRAEIDILEVLTFGLTTFGPDQAARYRNELGRCFEMLAENPLMGRAADAIAPSLRRHEHGSHVILYEQDEGGVLILAILHRRALRRLSI